MSQRTISYVSQLSTETFPISNLWDVIIRRIAAFLLKNRQILQ